MLGKEDPNCSIPLNHCTPLTTLLQELVNTWPMIFVFGAIYTQASHPTSYVRTTNFSGSEVGFVSFLGVSNSQT